MVRDNNCSEFLSSTMGEVNLAKFSFETKKRIKKGSFAILKMATNYFKPNNMRLVTQNLH